MAIHTVYLQVPDIIREGSPCSLATVISVAGSAPQVPGSSALFGRSGLICGTIGGGPAEYQVMLKAQQAIQNGQSEIISFDLAGTLLHQSDSICGGNMTILLDSQPAKHLSVWTELKQSTGKRQSGVLLSIIEETEDKKLNISRFWIINNDISSLRGSLLESVGMALRELQEDNRPGAFRFLQVAMSDPGSTSTICLETVVPPPSLVIAGAGHVGKAMASIGKFLGFEVTVWDDRSDFARPDHIPEADHHFSGSFEDFARNLSVDANTWLVIVTRGHQFDATVLKEWIKTKPAYLGMMGSRAKIVQMREQFLSNGWASEEEWNKVYTPVGFKIGAKTVEEIAVSIAAQLIQVKYEITPYNNV